MKLNRAITILGGLALPVALYGVGCSSTATTPGFGDDAGGSSGSHSGSTSGSSGSGSSSSSSSGSSSSNGGSTSSNGGSTSSSGGGSTSSSSGGGSTSSSSGGSSTSSSGGSSSGGTQTDAQCDAMSSGQDCFNCCATNHMEGYNTAQAALSGCECGTSGLCQSQCATEYCANPPANSTSGDPCDTCLNNTTDPDAGTGCYDAFATACSADPDCVDLYGQTGCATGCPNTP